MSQNISQEELALLAGVERAYVGHIERGKKNPTILTVSRLADALGCNVKDLFELADVHKKVQINLVPGRKRGKNAL